MSEPLLTLRTSVLGSHGLLGSYSNVSATRNETCTTLPSTFEKWKSARILLSSAIQAYLAACISLGSSCNLPARQSPEGALTKDIITAIDSELESLEAEEADLCNMRKNLIGIRNSSSALAQINILPPEILSSIFALSNVRCFHGGNNTSTLYNFSSVCTYWRSIAVNLPSLWDHVDVGPSTPKPLANLLLKRASCRPIYLHVYEPKPVNDIPTDDNKVAEVLNVLERHGNRIHTLDLESYSHSRNLAGPVLNAWFDIGGASTTKSLLVYRPKAGLILTPEGYNTNVTLASRSENADAVLRPLTKLHLQNTRFDWDSSAYHNLVDLQLSCFRGRTEISIPELMGILSANPRLAILKLSSIHITSPDDWINPSPINMTALRVLCLFHIDPDGLNLLLPSIRLPASPVEIGIGPTPFGQIYDRLNGLFVSSHIRSFYCWQKKEEPFPGWASMLRLTPHLCNLVMDEIQMTNEPFAETNKEGSQSFSRPRMDCAILSNSVVTLDGLKALIDVCNVRNLRLEICKSLDGELDGVERIRASLTEIYPDLGCVVSDESTTWRLKCCTIFNR